jgi:sugar phosphate isomerase/epimerase
MAITTRRTILTAGVAAALASTSRAAGSAIRLGGPIFLKSEDPAELAREHRRLGYAAAYCPNATVEQTDRVRAIEKAFAAEKVVISEVGAWKNMLDPDAAKRRENLAYVTQRLALAEAVAAMCCVDIAGSFSPDVWYGPHPKNLSKEFFDATVENCRKVIDAVKPKRTYFTVEMMGWSLPTGPDEYLQLLRAVDRPAFAVHFDPCNGVNSPSRFYNNGAFISECVRKLGKWIRSCHAKDLEWKPEMNVHFVEVIPGRGSVDYKTFLRDLASLPHQPPLMLEHLRTSEEYKEGAEYIRKQGAAAGVSFA